MAQDLTGAVFADKYLILQQIGGGAMGHVYLARHTVLDRQFAVKVLKRRLCDDQVLTERFRREAHAMSRLEHPNIVYVANYGRTDEDQPYLVMEYVAGQTLKGAIEAEAPDPVPLPRVQTILEQLFSAAEAAHAKGVVHRDLKPDNILLTTREDGTELVKVLDYGFAKLLGETELTELTQDGEVFGTPRYMAPEQATGTRIDHRTDLYSLGIIAYELVAGRVPFDSNNLPQLLMAQVQEVPEPPSRVRPAHCPPLPPMLEAIILRCLEKKPADRPASAAEVLEVLAHTRARTLPASPVTVEVTFSDVLGEDPDLAEWSEVTVETTITAFSQTAVAPAEIIEGVWVDDEYDPQDVWSWDDAASKAYQVARKLQAIHRAPAGLGPLLTTIEKQEQQARAAEADVAVALGRRQEIDQAVRDHDAQLRHAIVDLTTERNRALESGSGGKAIADLEFQIGELEGRLAELYQEQSTKVRDLGRFIGQRQTDVQRIRQLLVEQQVQLVNLLHKSRPDSAPQPIQMAYDELALILRALQSA